VCAGEKWWPKPPSIIDIISLLWLENAFQKLLVWYPFNSKVIRRLFEGNSMFVLPRSNYLRTTFEQPSNNLRITYWKNLYFLLKNSVRIIGHLIKYKGRKCKF
jgi:hypothetical protein